VSLGRATLRIAARNAALCTVALGLSALLGPGLLAGPGLPLRVAAQAGSATTVTVERGERLITVVQRAAAVDGARSILNNPNCEPEVRTNLFFGPAPGFVETLIDATRLTSSLAIVRVPDGDGDETIELLPGRASFDRPGCLERLEALEEAVVVLEQGRTTVVGSRFWLEQETDVAIMDGPVTLRRTSEDGGVTLEASAARLWLDIGTEVATLEGDVVVSSADRVSRAERLELDEEAGIALLTGDPAVSSSGSDEIRGRTLRYDLETDDVIAIGGVGARFEVDLD